MYSKEQIIEEMKRIAASMGGALSEKDFEQRSTIPISTLRFHLGSWQRALKEAGLKYVEKTPDTKPKSNDELLLELIHLYKDSGELPTPALIEAKGQYKVHHYTNRWKSIADAFQRAKDKFPEKFKATPKKDHKTEMKERREVERMEQLERLEQLEKVEKVENEDQVDQGDQLEKTITDNIREEKSASEEEILVLEGEQEMNHNHQGIKAEKIKFIPQTIKPQKAKTKPRVSVEPLDFRGLRFAPASRQGVVYLFGMISDELGFIIESFIAEFPDCEGKRCVDQEKNQWEPVRIQFEYKSSDFKTRISAKGYNESQCDLIVCWNHNWEDSPIEVLELRSVLQYLE
ncbi:MAG: hypothetical protein PVH61_36925 [Candidatus Aminicenantes bacterium]|jgi:hypothetical protein